MDPILNGSAGVKVLQYYYWECSYFQNVEVSLTDLAERPPLRRHYKQKTRVFHLHRAVE